MLGFWLMLFTIKLYSRKDILKIDNLVFLDKVNLTRIIISRKVFCLMLTSLTE